MKINSGRKLIKAIADYIDECSAKDSESKSKKICFPNVAGFCRFAGIPVSDYLALKKRFPFEGELSAAYFEDAALNSGATATLLGLYLKHYGFWSDDRAGFEVDCDHDIFADGV